MAEGTRFSFLAISAAMMISVALPSDDPDCKRQDQIGCNPVHADANATAFWQSRDTVLESLSSNVSLNGYANLSENSVSGLAVCRKYLSPPECSDCVTEAAKLIKANCLNNSGGRIHLDGCFLHYENYSNILHYENYTWDLGAIHHCFSTNDSDPQAFSQRATALSSQLIENASANNSYATGSIDGSLYGLAQCWPYLTASSCQTCLNYARNLLLDCTPKQEGRGLEAGCFMRYSTHSFFSGSTNPTPSSGKSSSEIVYILLGSIGGTSLIAVMCLALFCRRIGHRNGYDRSDENVTARDNFEHFFFEYEVLRDSTGNFDRRNMLGKGGFGEVYKGILPDGTDVAVKKLNGRHESTQGAQEFLTEVKLLTSVRHRNLVRLLGCCTRGNERLLVYEFMSNNGLHKHLFGEIGNALFWENRLDIIVGTARGLSYLHEDSNMRIIHRDIKCANILLDDKFNPKIADFGMARFFPEGETHVSTRVGGTLGYTAPEYAVHGQLTEKADVYSYGIVVLEILSGRKCVDATLPGPMCILLEWVWNKYKEGKVLDIIDPKLEGQYPGEKALRVITVALLCTQGSSGLRPAMSWVATMLTNDIEIRVHPTQPTFVGGAAARSTSSTATTNSATSTSAAATRPSSSVAATDYATSTSAAAATHQSVGTMAISSHQSPGTMTISLFPQSRVE